MLHHLPSDTRHSYEALVAALNERYGEGPLRFLYHAQLRNRRQAATETISHVADDIERLAHLAFPACPEDTVEAVATMAFIDAISSVEVQDAIRLACPKSLRAERHLH